MSPLTVVKQRRRPLSVSLFDSLSFSISFPLVRRIRARLSGKMHARLIIQADSLRVSARLPQNGAARFSQSQSGAVENSVFGVVLQTVVDDQQEVALERFKAEIAVRL